jgi:Xaa-Pro dipeptidase
MLLMPATRMCGLWQEDESPYQLLAQSLKERGLANGRIGMEETIHFVFVDGISQASPHAPIASATPVTAGLPHD